MTSSMVKFGLECTLEANFYYILGKEDRYHFLLRWNEEKCYAFYCIFLFGGGYTGAQVATSC